MFNSRDAMKINSKNSKFNVYISSYFILHDIYFLIRLSPPNPYPFNFPCCHHISVFLMPSVSLTITLTYNSTFKKIKHCFLLVNLKKSMVANNFKNSLKSNKFHTIKSPVNVMISGGVLNFKLIYTVVK
jgi:hypothetical protein